MTGYPPSQRFLPSSQGSQGSPEGAYERPAGDMVSLGQIFGVIRRRYKLILLMAVVGIGAGAFLAIRTPATYRAVSTIRLAGERREITGEIENDASDLESSSRT